MNLGRIFANAVARRLAYVLVAALLAWCGMGNVRAANTSYPNQEAAYAGCVVAYETYPVTDDVSHPTGGGRCVLPVPSQDGGPTGTYRCEVEKVANSGGNPFYITCNVPGHTSTHSWSGPCPGGTEWNPETHTCGGSSECSVLDAPLGAMWVVWDTIEEADENYGSVCHDGCNYLDEDSRMSFERIDGKIYENVTGFIASGETCTGTPDGNEPDPTPPPDDSDDDGVSDGNDSAPNNPGDTGGEGQGDGDEPGEGEDGSETPSTCGGEGQPPCEAGQGNGTGSGNGNASGGGGDCASPPHSSGDAILAQIAYQAWATRCSVEGRASAYGDCAQPLPDCSGSAALCQLLNDNRRRECAEKAQAEADAAANEALANEPDGLEGITEESIWGPAETGGGQISETRYGGPSGGTCSLGVTLGGQAFELPEQFWDVVPLIHWLLTVAGYLAAAIWLARG